jgi:lipid-binding SYLF domain-containing protein
MGKSLTSMNANDNVHASVFGRNGLMAGIGREGNKITKLE